MPQPRPFPRSLVPLPGESLPGFLLRLSCRLNQPPARIAELTGLKTAGVRETRISAMSVTGIPAAALPAFTRMTRLTDSQAAQLGMASWQERYPFPVPDAADGPRRLNSRTVLAPATRYCPDCLTGDGSAIQEALGGAWLKAWHIPVVFACPLHRRLLEHRCPDCGASSGACGLVPRPRSCPRCVQPGSTPPSAGQNAPSTKEGGPILTAAEPGWTTPGDAVRQAPSSSPSRTRSSAFSTAAAPPPR
jgi:hypothetical protein